MTTTDTSEAPDLKPCPFCGTTPLAHGVDGSSMVSIWCTCGARGPDTGFDVFNAQCDIDMANKQWNTRADIHQSELDAAYERGLRDAARYLEPANEPDDWTDYAKQMHEASLRILALIPQPEEAGK